MAAGPQRAVSKLVAIRPMRVGESAGRAWLLCDWNQVRKSLISLNC